MPGSRNSWIAALALIVMAGGSLSAHRRDEYLQAARVAIDPERVEIELDLTPGIAVADRVLRAIDLDADTWISESEVRAYSGQVLRAMRIDVDGAPLDLKIIGSTFPEASAVRKGEGTMRVQAVAGMPRSLSTGTHYLRYRNSHRSDIGVYLANALVPVSDRVTIRAQRRDPDQRDVTIEYVLGPERATRIRGGVWVALAGASIWFVVLWCRRATPARSAFRRTSG